MSKQPAADRPREEDAICGIASLQVPPAYPRWCWAPCCRRSLHGCIPSLGSNSGRGLTRLTKHAAGCRILCHVFAHLCVSRHNGLGRGYTCLCHVEKKNEERARSTFWTVFACLTVPYFCQFMSFQFVHTCTFEAAYHVWHRAAECSTFQDPKTHLIGNSLYIGVATAAVAVCQNVKCTESPSRHQIARCTFRWTARTCPLCSRQ